MEEEPGSGHMPRALAGKAGHRGLADTSSPRKAGPIHRVTPPTLCPPWPRDPWPVALSSPLSLFPSLCRFWSVPASKDLGSSCAPVPSLEGQTSGLSRAAPDFPPPAPDVVWLGCPRPGQVNFIPEARSPPCPHPARAKMLKWVEGWPQRYVHLPEPMSGTLRGKRVLADVIKDLEVRRSS